MQIQTIFLLQNLVQTIIIFSSAASAKQQLHHTFSRGSLAQFSHLALPLHLLSISPSELHVHGVYVLK